MRNSCIVPLAIGKDAQVLEARVIDLRHLFAILPDNLNDISVITYLQKHLADLLHILSECIVLPDNKTINDLSLTESELILTAWWKLHEDFFLRALAVCNLRLDTEPTSASLKTSTPHSPDSQSAVITSRGTGDGAIS